MTRYNHIYGGVATVIGEFTPEQVEAFVWEKEHTHINLRGVIHQGGKLLDLFFDKKEVVGYATRNGNIRLECINYV
jgi:hypothetical protein